MPERLVISVRPEYAALLQRGTILLLAAYCLGQSLFPELERVLLWGEVIACALCWSILTIPYTTVLERKITYGILLWIFFLPCYGLLITALVWSDEAVSFFVLRHLALFYYALFFFGGLQYGLQVIEFLARYWILVVIGFLIQRLGFGAAGIAHSLFSGFLWIVCLAGRNTKGVFWGGIAGILLIHLWGMTAGERATDVVILLLFLSLPLLRFLKPVLLFRPQNRLVFAAYRVSLVCIFIGALVGSAYITDFRVALMSAGQPFTNSTGTFGITDTGHWWRLFFASYLIDRFRDHPYGIGLGTPIFYGDLRDFIHFLPKAEEPYVVGAHNFILTYLVRLGVVFLGVFAWLLSSVSRLIYEVVVRMGRRAFTATPESRLVCASLLAWGIALVQSLFNVIIETPIYAGLFWFLFGLTVRFMSDYVARRTMPANG
ncbi:MAG: hypothetical protein HY543_06350 [Deltaproteobacteria bacterium]|nr:hypothetical protein [Deltaproteobacteria bacterium]